MGRRGGARRVRSETAGTAAGRPRRNGADRARRDEAVLEACIGARKDGRKRRAAIAEKPEMQETAAERGRNAGADGAAGAAAEACSAGRLQDCRCVASDGLVRGRFGRSGNTAQ